MKCPMCQAEMKEKLGNISTTHDGIEVTVVGASYFGCDCTPEKAYVSEELRNRVKNSVQDKKIRYPNSSPYLYINLLDHSHGLEDLSEEACTKESLQC